jgi:ferredoxin
MNTFTVDDARCTRCNLCVLDCPSRIIVLEGDAVPFIPADREAQCIHCQHCLAICPTAAVSIDGKRPEDSLALSADLLPTGEQMMRLMRGRRSVRQYRDENVDPALLQELLAALAHTPTGVNRCALTFTVIDDKDVMQRVKDQMMAVVREAGEAGRIPDRAAYLRFMAGAYFNDGVDTFFRGAPHALIVSARPEALSPTADVTLACAYFDLLAAGAGLGAVCWGMLNLACETLPDLKPLFGLAPGQAYSGILFGVPAVSYPRTVQRDDAAEVKRLTL